MGDGLMHGLPQRDRRCSFDTANGRGGRLVSFVLLLLLTPTPAVPQELVLHVTGTREYHRPGCEAVRNPRSVLAMPRGQAERRGLKPHEGCDPSRASGEASAAPVFVYVDLPVKPSPVGAGKKPANKYYHREKCTRLGKERQKLRLEEAGKKYWPCPRCKPPIRKRR